MAFYKAGHMGGGKRVLQHFDGGGFVQPLNSFNSAVTMPIVDSAGSLVQGVSKAFTAQNDFNAANPGNDPRVSQQYGTVVQNQANQNALAAALQAQMNGQGPNPAQAQFQQNAAQIGKQQAGAIASAKGVSPALAAQLASQSGSSAMQDSAGKAATLAAQQQLGAEGELGGVYGNIGQEALGQQQVTQQGILGATNINANVAAQNTDAINKTTGGLLNGAGAALGLAHGGKVPRHPLMFLAGGSVPGKAEVEGDSLKNDKVPAMLSPGEVVVPRSLVHNPDRAADFIRAINEKGSRPKSYGDVLKSRKGAKK